MMWYYRKMVKHTPNISDEPLNNAMYILQLHVEAIYSKGGFFGFFRCFEVFLMIQFLALAILLQLYMNVPTV